MKVKGLVISVAQVGRIMARGEAAKRSDENGGSRNGGGRQRDGFITEAVLAETLARYPGCRCTELGLQAGVRITDMISLGAGCCGSGDHVSLDGKQRWFVASGYVCQRLDAVRRVYGR